MDLTRKEVEELVEALRRLDQLTNSEGTPIRLDFETRVKIARNLRVFKKISAETEEYRTDIRDACVKVDEDKNPIIREGQMIMKDRGAFITQNRSLDRESVEVEDNKIRKFSMEDLRSSKDSEYILGSVLEPLIGVIIED